jgi:hypothetical protein
LFRRSLQPDTQRLSLAALRWSGPALVAAGLFATGALAVTARENAFAGWFLSHALAPERVLPLIGLGAACGLVGARIFALTLALFGLGIAVGFAAQGTLIALIYSVTEGPTYLFLTGPISCLAIGLALVPGARLLPWLLPIAALVDGAMLAIAIFLTDPTLDDPLFVWTPLLAAFWIVGAVALTLQAFRRGWFTVFGRILGSWLVAVGLLYGGVSLLPILKPPPPPTDTSQESTRGAELNRSIPQPPRPQLLKPSQPESGGFFGGAQRLPP